MHFLSVKETAARLNLSERRVQQLCETGRICGARRIHNAWMIPNDAPKPEDERFRPVADGDMVSLLELCRELSISTATGRNWVKLGKLIPTGFLKATPFLRRNMYLN